MTNGIRVRSFHSATAVRLGTAATLARFLRGPAGVRNNDADRETSVDSSLQPWRSEEESPSEQEVIARAIDEHGASFPVDSSSASPVATDVVDSIAEHEAHIEAWLARP